MEYSGIALKLAIPQFDLPEITEIKCHSKVQSFGQAGILNHGSIDLPGGKTWDAMWGNEPATLVEISRFTIWFVEKFIAKWVKLNQL